MTPKRMRIWIELVSRRQRHELAARLMLDALAARGDPKAVKEQFGKLSSNDGD